MIAERKTLSLARFARGAEFAEGTHGVDPMLRRMHRPNIPGTTGRCRKMRFNFRAEGAGV